MSWETDYAPWRLREPTSLDAWSSAIPAPVDPQPENKTLWTTYSLNEQDELFQTCLEEERAAFTDHVLQYRSPRLDEVQSTVKSLLKERGMRVTVTVFWGRARYVSLLSKYLERNLNANLGIIDELLIVTKNRESSTAGADEAADILNRMKEQYPGHVTIQPFCAKAYGCAFDQFMTRNDTVYIKVDDDIIFIKDGSIEHLTYQMLTNTNYAFFSASIVNNPHSYAVHAFAGAHPPVTYHWRGTGVVHEPPFVPVGSAYKWYYGKNVYDATGSRAHESFIYNAAHGRLDVYTFDIFNMHQCRCGKPQEGLDMCAGGYYRWSINGFVFTRAISSQYSRPVPSFDEPAVGLGWTSHAAPHRVGIVGESLFVHAQYTRQRSSKPDFGLREEILLPWYHMLMRQYLAAPFGGWAGNATLLEAYEHRAYMHGEDRFSRWPKSNRFKTPTLD